MTLQQKSFFHQVALALKTIHDTGVSHRDLSLENVFLTRIRNQNGEVKLIAKVGDFGIALPMSPSGTFSVGSQRPGKTRYMAPEVFQGRKTCDGCLVDVWSLGIILLSFIICSTPIKEPSSRCRTYAYTMKYGVGALLDMWKFSADPAAIDLLNSMLCPAERRINIDQILAHRWLSTSPLSTGLR